MNNYYINRGIKLFNQLPANFKLIDHKIKFKIMVKNYLYNPFNIFLMFCHYYFVLLCLFFFIIIKVVTIILSKS